MALARLLLLAAAAQKALCIGFSTYEIIFEGQDNSGTVAYSSTYSDTLFLYIQINAGQDHSAIISDFETLCQNYGSQGVSVVPRVCYQEPGTTTISTEPSVATLLPEVSQFAQVFEAVTEYINIPVVQAGFLGQYGEWHNGQYCENQGTADTSSDLTIKKEVVDTLLGSGHKVAMRYPQDHSAIYNGNRSVTLHDDCIFDGGMDGYDGGTFPTDDRQTWVNYTIEVAGDNTFGGEGCNNAGDSTYDWSDYDAVCGDEGIITYINELQIAYLNYETPPPFAAMIQDSAYASCVADIKAALGQWN